MCLNLKILVLGFYIQIYKNFYKNNLSFFNPPLPLMLFDILSKIKIYPPFL